MLIAFCFLCFGSGAFANIVLDKKYFYADLSGKINLKFGYAFNENIFDIKPKDKISSYSNANLFYLQRFSKKNQAGFNVKLGISDVIKLTELDLDELKVEKAYLIVKNANLGSIEYGKNDLVSHKMLINTSKISAATGGVNGDWVNYTNLRGNHKKDDGAGYDKDNVFWVKPNVYTSYHGLSHEFKQSSVNYISPEIYNFQLGLSYVLGETDDLQYSNILAAGLSYKNSISDDISINVALTGEVAPKKEIKNSITLNNLMHWNLGMKVKYFNLDGIFSYGNGNKSGRKMNPETSNTYYLNTGIAYHSDLRKLSLTYFQSVRDIETKGINRLTAYAASLEYPLFHGSSYYFELVKFNAEEANVTEKNSGYVFLAGLNFNL